MSALPSEALILCAGEGSRLRPLTASTPKPLAPFLNLPMLRQSLRRLARAGLRRVWLNAHHLSEQLEAFAASNPEPGLELRVIVEDERLGTGGALPNLAPQLRGEQLLVQVADVLHDLDLEALAEHHRTRGAVATMALTTRVDPAHFGAVEIDADGRLCDIIGRLARPGTRALVNASTHLLEVELFDRFPQGASCLVRQGYLEWLAAGLACEGFVDERPWAETGTPGALLGAQAAALRGDLPLDAELLAEGGARLGGGAALVHASARVDPGATLLDGCTIGAAAHVETDAHLERCLVLPGARVPAGHVARGEILGLVETPNSSTQPTHQADKEQDA